MEVMPAPLPTPEVIRSLSKSLLKRVLDDIGLPHGDAKECDLYGTLPKDAAIGSTLHCMFRLAGKKMKHWK